MIYALIFNAFDKQFKEGFPYSIQNSIVIGVNNYRPPVDKNNAFTLNTMVECCGPEFQNLLPIQISIHQCERNSRAI